METNDANHKLDEILSQASSIDFETHGGRLLEFNDGHIPETVNTTEHPTRLVEYPEFFQKALIHVHNDALDECLVDALFEATIQEDQPWGTYVTKQHLQNYWNNCNIENKTQTEEADASWRKDKDQLALRVAALFFEKAMSSHASLLSSSSSLPTSPPNAYSLENASTCDSSANKEESQHPSLLLSKEQFETKVHGIAIWALSAGEHSSVPYHLDYAEQVRYASNLIVPPLLAGTLHCTPPNLRVVGGDYCASLHGLEHYRSHGYKELHKPVEINDMVRIPYQYNCLILASGHLPHLSTRIESIEFVDSDLEGTSVSSSFSADQLRHRQRRVIVGFNVFGYDFGPLVQQAPEHSDAFRAWVAERRRRRQTHQQQQGRLTLSMVQANPVLAQRLIQAKRAKVRADLLESQQRLDEQIDSYLRKQGAKQGANAVTVSDLVAAFGKNDGSWPTANDVHAHLYRQDKHKRYKIVPLVSSAKLEGENIANARMDCSSQVVLLD
jgi:hypothetical protein